MKRISILIVFMLIFSVGCSKENNNDNLVEKVENQITEVQKKDGLEFKVISLTNTAEGTSMIAQIENTTDKEYILQPFVITFKNAKDEVILSLQAIEEEMKIEANSIVPFNKFINYDLDEAVSIEYEFVE